MFKRFLPSYFTFIFIFCFFHLKVFSGNDKHLDSLLFSKDTAKGQLKVGILYELAVHYYETGEYVTAMEYNSEAYKLSESIGYKSGMAGSSNNIGQIYQKQGNYPEALKYYFSALQLNEELNEDDGIGSGYTNIAIIYKKQGNYPEALKMHLAALRVRERTGDKKNISASYNNIGSVYRELHKYDEALSYYLKSLKLKEELGYKKGVGIAYNNIGEIYELRGDKKEALENYFSSLALFKEADAKDLIVISNINISNLYFLEGQYTEAEKYAKEGLSISRKIGYKEAIRDFYKVFYRIDSATGDYKSALDNHLQYINYRDSLINEENTGKSVRAQMNFEFDKKEALTKAVATEEKQRQKVITYSVSAALLIALILGLFIFREYRQKQKANIEITHQKEIIEEKQKDILDSINYAKRIQQSLLPTEKYIDKNLKRLRNK